MRLKYMNIRQNGESNNVTSNLKNDNVQDTFQ